ncbi:hypothetical protein [Streptomyces mirabilis]|uniref:hypothetical protein n=1 Tax=Streptomyces mirabilis TaxID=68239 RepID=UPI0033BDCA5F
MGGVFSSGYHPGLHPVCILDATRDGKIICPSGKGVWIMGFEFDQEFACRYKMIWGDSERTGMIDPKRDVEAWRDLVEECRSGYSDSLAEYDFDLHVRDFLQRAIDSSALQLVNGYGDFRESIELIDREFIEIATVETPWVNTQGLGWWHLRLPARGGEEFSDDVRGRIGVVIGRI